MLFHMGLVGMELLVVVLRGCIHLLLLCVFLPFLSHFQLIYRCFQVRDGLNPSNVYGNATDLAITNFPYAMHAPITFSLNSTSYPSIQGYSFYTGTLADSGVQMTFDLH